MFAPNFASSIAEASPIPCVLPHTIAFLFFNDISIYSIMGTQVDQFALDGSHRGNKKISWHPVGHFPTGTYIIQASTKNLIETQKILFIK